MKLKADIEGRIKRALAFGKPVRRKALLCLADTPLERIEVDYRLRRLLKSGLIKRVRFGVYVAAGTKTPSINAIPPMRELPTGPSAEKVIKMLDRARLPEELRREIGISRQRIHVILRLLLAANKVTRRKVKGKKRHLYVSV